MSDTRSRVAEAYHNLQDALDEYITAEKEMTREFVESQYEVPEPEPALVQNVAGEPYYVDETACDECECCGECDDVLDQEEEKVAEPQVLGIHNPDANVTLLLVGDVTDLTASEFMEMQMQHIDAFYSIER